MRVEQDQLLIEIDGPGVRPETLHSRSALELVSTYVDLLEQVAETEEGELKLLGLDIQDKCVAFVMRANDPGLAQRAAIQAGRYIAKATRPPHGLGTRTERVREALAALPEGQQAKIIIGSWEQMLAHQAAPDEAPLESLVSLRARPSRVGGETPTVRLTSKSEDRPFTLRLPRELAQQLGAHLYGEVDIEARVHRGHDGNIDGGELLGFEPVEDGDPRVAWAQWAKDVIAEWNGMDDIEKELGRDG